MTTATPRTRAFGPPPTVLSFLGVPLLAMLALELLLGMTLNLFVTVPANAPASILVTSPVLLLHVLLGLALLGISGRAVGLSHQVGDSGALRASVLTLLSVAVAFVSGLSFVFGPASPYASFAMAAGFSGAFLGAGLLLWARRGAPEPVPLATGGTERDRPPAPN